ncbi:bifunctional hydroxymethylpyrimidine kinase/phosphomethylpyrimidine kinase [Orrella sp. 11846]|uniref:bifunctional hydroxymethylpyrimidine kinase/phosphomethylpyrimidine kinase n=1 Tax=Orrella sp. 11846 TaxID=3409913 RepID=UPI003B5C95CE
MLPISHKVSHSPTPVVLLIGLFDPTGRQDVPADVITCAAQGLHAVCAITGTALADSAIMLHIEPAHPEQLDEQIRLLLEDTPVHAIKVGHIANVEQVSIIAQIAADYAHVPLILHLSPKEVVYTDTDDEDGEDDHTAQAILELLVPQSELVVTSARLAARWSEDELPMLTDLEHSPRGLLEMGASHVLLTHFRQRPGVQVNLLTGSQGETQAWPAVPMTAGTQETTGLLATAIAAGLANGLELMSACDNACQYEALAQAQAFQAGMGQRTAQRLPDDVGDARSTD